MNNLTDDQLRTIIAMLVTKYGDNNHVVLNQMDYDALDDSLALKYSAESGELSIELQFPERKKPALYIVK